MPSPLAGVSGAPWQAAPAQDHPGLETSVFCSRYPRHLPASGMPGTVPGDSSARNKGAVTCHTQLLVSSISAKKRNQGPGEKPDSRAGAANTGREPGHPLVLEDKDGLEDTKRRA